MPVNFEFKAASDNLQKQEALLVALEPSFIGSDHQVDTYFEVPHGRLKLRQGTIENALIYYERSDLKGAKISNVSLYQHHPDDTLKEVLERALKVIVVVNKIRKIYFKDNVKFHFDQVAGLGEFIEVEAIDKKGLIGIATLKEQCNFYAKLFHIRDEDYIRASYSDLLMGKIPSL